MVTIRLVFSHYDTYLHNVSSVTTDYDQKKVIFKKCTTPQRYIKVKKYSLVDVPFKDLNHYYVVSDRYSSSDV